MMLAVLPVLLNVVLSLGEPVVQGPLGEVRGTVRNVLDVQVESFLGIPYAKPPTGKLRFARPQAFGPVGSFDATGYGSSCPQPMSSPLQNFSERTDSENCLFLNVFRRTGTNISDKKAVVVLIHGGGFVWGSSGNVEYNMAPLAGIGDVITVSFNYRLGFLGFGYLEDTDFKNLGLLDQRLALEWVRENIGMFGGDPDRVTLIGVSAGSMSVNAHIVTPLNTHKKKLFRAAFMDAGVISGVLINDPGIAENGTKCVARTAGCADDENLIDCLREVELADLLQRVATCGTKHVRFGPVADGVFLPKNAEEYLKTKAGDFLKVKTMIGYARNEGSMFAAMRREKYPETMTDEEFIDVIEEMIRAFSFRVEVKGDERMKKDLLGQYLKKFVDPFTAVEKFIGDGRFVCPSNAFIENYARVNDQVYVYRFERLLEGNYFSFDPEVFGVYHISPFVHFTGTYLGSSDGNHEVLDADKEFMLEAMRVLSTFAKEDERPAFRGVEWPRFSENENILVVDNRPWIRSGLPHKARCQAVFPYFEGMLHSSRTEL